MGVFIPIVAAALIVVVIGQLMARQAEAIARRGEWRHIGRLLHRLYV